jgi:NADPH-dependent ferric siderophore reductase
MAPEDQPIGAYYTIRRWRPETAELDMLFVLHGHDGGPGGQAAHAVPMRASERQRASGHQLRRQHAVWPGNAINGQAAAWAAGAASGDPVALWGPRTAFDPPAGTEWFLLVADDTGLPAVAAIIESLPDTTPIVVVAEVDSEEDRQPVPAGAHVDVRWCFRRGAPAGGSTLLVDTVREQAWPSGTGYAWGGAESRCITAVRRHVRDEREMPRQAVSMTGYWRRD